MQRIMGGHFGARERSIDRALVAMNEVVVKRIFDVGGAIWDVEETSEIRFVLREEQIGMARAKKPALAVLPVLEFNAGSARKAGGRSRNRAAQILAPGPGVAKPELREDVERSGFGPAIHSGDSNENVLDVGFGILDENIEIAVLGKDAGVEQFEFRLAAIAATVFFEQPCVRKFCLRIFVKHAHIAVRGSGIQIKVIFLHVFAVIALVPGEAEEAFLEDGVAAVPEREPEAHHLMTVADSCNAVFAPAISARARVVVREIFPSRAVRAVIFADRAPLALGKVGTPALPVFLARARFFEAAVFCSWDSWHER